jgi:hypothetical protein
LLYASQFNYDLTAKDRIERLIDSCSFYKAYNPKDIYLTLLRCNNIPAVNYDFVIDKYGKDSWERAQFVGNRCQDLFSEFEFNGYQNHNMVKYFIPKEAAIKLLDRMELILNEPKIKNDSTQMNLAIYFKKRGFYYANILNEKVKADNYFANAIITYNSVSPSHKLKNHYWDFKNWVNTFKSNAEWFYNPYLINEYEIRDGLDCGHSNIGRISYARNEFSSPFINYIVSNSNENYLKSAEGLKILLSFSGFGDDQLTVNCMNQLKWHYSNQKGNDEINRAVKIILYRTYSLLQTKEEAGFNLLDSLLNDFPMDFTSSNGWLSANVLKLAQIGDTLRSMKLIGFIKSDEEKRKLLLRICYQLQNGEGVENSFFYLNELLKNNTDATKMGMSFYRVLGKIGGGRIEKLAQDKFRNIPELMKPFALDNWVLGTAENGNYYKAKKLIPASVSETKELKLINLILQAEIIKKSNKIIENAFEGNWNDAPYFELDKKNNESQFNSLD